VHAGEQRGLMQLQSECEERASVPLFCLLAALILIVNELLLQETFHAGDPPVQERRYACSLLASLALLDNDRNYNSNTQFLPV